MTRACWFPVLWALAVLAVWLAEHLNAWAATHWKTFSRQNYFDPSGLFISVVYSGPLMVLCIIILVRLARCSGQQTDQGTGHRHCKTKSPCSPEGSCGCVLALLVFRLQLGPSTTSPLPCLAGPAHVHSHPHHVQVEKS